MPLNLGDLTITSTAFEPGGPIPDRHARDGDDLAPPLAWAGVPEGTRQLALVCHDPDAPLVDGFAHWVAYGISPSSTGVAEGGELGVPGRNDYGDLGYGGPQPPPGHGPHHYYFWLYALDTELDGSEGLTRAELLERIDGHVLEQARLVGTYER